MVTYRQGSTKGYDLVGKRFSFLTVLKDTGKRDPKKGKVWLCRCDCGNTTEATTVHLNSKHKRSCGCLASGNARGSRRAKQHKVKSGRLPISKRIKRDGRSAKRYERRIKKLPAELESVNYSISKDYSTEFELVIFENGRIFEKYPNFYIECSFGNVSNGYKTVTITDEGKQKNLYVHRLLAETFIPNDNPEEKILVLFKDGDKNNLSLDNLLWGSNSDRANLTVSLLGDEWSPVKNLPLCKVCGESHCRDEEEQICSKCKAVIEANERRRLVIQKRIDSVSDLNFNLLTNRQRLIAGLRLEGCTLNEIADFIGISRQAVDNSLRRSRERVERLQNEVSQKEQKKQIKNKKIETLKDNANSTILKELRLSKGLSGDFMGELIGVTCQSYLRKERKPETFKIVEAITVARFFGVDVEKLFFDLVDKQ